MNMGVVHSGTWQTTAKNTGNKINEMKQTAENQVKAGTAGGIEAVVKAINAHIDNPGVCRTGCGALWNMTESSDKSTNKQQQ